MILAVYGNFREGERLSHYLKQIKQGAETKIVELSGVKLFVMGEAPGAVITKNPKDKAVVELIKRDRITRRLEDQWMLFLDRIEGVDQGLYSRSRVTTPLGEAYIYTCNLPSKGFPVITDWAEWTLKSDREKRKAFGKASQNSAFITLRS